MDNPQYEPKLSVNLWERAVDSFAIKSAAKRGEAIVALYHRVSPIPDSSYQPMPPEMFVYHCEQLRRHSAIITLAEMVNRISAGRSIAGCTSLTFDDGFKDFATYAYPILKRMGLPAVHFLVSEHVKDGLPTWNYRLNRVLLAESRSKEASSLKNEIGRLKVDARERWLSARENPTFPPLPAMLNVEDILQLDGDLIEWGSHTMTHASLPFCSADQIDSELRGSRDMLSSLLDRKIRFLSYPNGLSSKEVARCVQMAGYEAGISVGQKGVCVGGNIYELPRFGLDGLRPGRFGLELSGAMPFMRRMRGLFLGAAS